MSAIVIKSEMHGVDENDIKANELRDLARKYRLLLSSSNTGAWEYFPKENLLDCNKIYFSMLGRDIDDFAKGEKNLDNVWTELIHPDDRMETISRFFDYLVNPEGMFECFFRMQHANGNWIWICSRGGAIKDEKTGKVTSLIGTHIDITHQKQAEEEIQRERTLLRTLIDNLPDTIYVKDAEARKIIANKADLACIGGCESEADVIGKTDKELFPGEIGERGYNNDMEVLSGHPLLNKEEFFYDPQGCERWLSTSKVPVYDKFGRIDRILGIGHDITERKRSDEALRKLNKELNQQSKELKALNEQLIKQKEQELEKAIAQGKFEIASEVLHDIGNALVGFGSYLTRINRANEQSVLESLKSLNVFLKSQQAQIGETIGVDKANALVSITEGILKSQGENQGEIGTSVGELLHIVSHIQEILNIQRQLVRNHGSSHERKPVNMVDILDNCRSMLLASLEKKGIKLSMSVKQGNHIIKGDHTKLMQVMLNVLKNSVEAIDMESENKTIGISIASDKKHLCLIFTDNGKGFDEETSKKFFQRGFTTKKSGTGLGLYNCRSIVESHAGTFDITSDGPGLGSVTTIKFEL